MKKANIFLIANKTDRIIVFWPKDTELRELHTWHVRPETFIAVDNYFMKNMEIDLDEWVFHFFDDSIEISVDDIDKHGVELEYWLADPKLKKEHNE